MQIEFGTPSLLNQPPKGAGCKSLKSAEEI